MKQVLHEPKTMKLLEHFNELTLHPGNAAKLKGFILQLAVQGKLTKKWRAENPDVEPASELLKKIQQEKARLIKEKMIKKEKPLAPVSDEEVPYELPDGWVWSRLGEIGQINPRNIIDDELEIGFVPMKNIQQEYNVIPTFEKRVWNEVKKSFTHFRENDVAFAKITPCFENSKACIFKGLPNGFGAGTTELHVFRKITEDILPELVYIIFKSPKFLKAGEDQMTGSAGQKRVPKQYFSNHIIGVPPLEEQKAIVAIVDELFNEVEALEAQTKQRIQLKHDFVTSALRQLTSGQPEKGWAFLQPHLKTFFTEKNAVKQLRATVLELAVQGKLTKKWRTESPDVEPASELFKKIQQEKARLIKEKKIKKEKPLAPISDEEVPYELPDGWVWCRLGEVIKLKSGQDLNTTEYSDSESFGIPYITGASNLKDEKVIINRWTNAPRSIATNGDLLITCKGSGVGKMGWLNVPKAHIARQIMAINTFDSPLAYVKILMDINAVIYNKNAIGLIPGIDRNTVLKTIVGLPPEEEQKAIVSTVNDLMDLCDELENEIDRSTQQVEQLMQSCLKAVLEVEEVAQAE